MLALARSLCRLDRSQQAVRFLEGTGREEEPVLRSGAGTIAELKRPQAVDLERRPILAMQWTQEQRFAAGREIVGIDAAIAEIADEQHAAESTELARRQGKAPRRVQRTRRGDTP